MNQLLPFHRITLLSCFLFASLFSNATVREVTVIGDGVFPGTLRNAIDASQDGDSIVFNLFPGVIINLAQGPLIIGSEITIVGPGSENLTIQNFSGNIFRINAGAASNIHISGIRFEASPSGGFPGAIYGNSLNSLTIKGCEFYNCSSFISPGGGAISMANNTELVIDSTKFDFNSSSSNNGGAIYIGNNSRLVSYDCDFSSNSGNNGGAIVIDGVNSEFIIERNSFSYNDAFQVGGAIYSNSQLTTNKIIQSTFFSNQTTGSAGSNGAGVFVNDGQVEIVNSTFANNTAGDVGGGLYIENGIAQINSTYFGGNQGGAGDGPNNISIGSGTLTSLGHNFIETSTPNTGNATDIQGISDGSGRGSFGDNGGFTQTMPILQNSVVVDMGVDNGYTTDQSGKNRQSGFGADIGAFEYQYVAVIPTIASISPSFGVFISDTVTIRGSGYATVSGINFLGVTLSASQYTIISDDSIQVYIPAGISNSSDVRITTSAGESSPASFAMEIPYISQLNPSEAFVGDTVRLIGGGLFGIDSISFDGIRGQVTQTYGRDSLDIKIPTGIVGSVNVEIHSSIASTSTRSILVLSCPASNIVYVYEEASGDGTGHSWGDALEEIGPSFSLAKACPIVDQIWVAQGTYHTSENPEPDESLEFRSNLALYGGFQSGEAVLGDRDPSIYETTIDGEIGGGDDYNYHIISATNVTGVLIDGFTLKNANSDGSSASNQDMGGGVFVDNSQVNLHEVKLFNNIADFGGGIAVINGGKAILENCLIEDNNVRNDGGALYTQSSVDSMYVYRSRFYLNRATEFNGSGGVSLNNGVSWFENVIFEANSVFQSGSVIVNEASGVLDMINCTVSNNTIQGFVNPPNEVELEAPSAAVGAGALNNVSGGDYRIKNSIFWGNKIGNDESDPTSEIDGDPSADANAIEFSNIQGHALGGNNYDVDPEFIDPFGEPGDYTLPITSPMINAGNNSFVTQSKDYQGEDRIKGNAVEIGAYEMCNPLEVYSTVDDTICGTLRYAIMYAEMNAGADTINFALPNNSVISIDSALPILQNGNVVINGDMNTDGTPDIILRNNSNVVDGIVIDNSASNSIDGLRIIGFNETNSAAIRITGSGSTSNYVTSCILGLNESDVPVPNQNGIYLQQGASSNFVGNATAEGRNVISGNVSGGIVLIDGPTSGNKILGNVIGLSPSLNSVVPNQISGIILTNGASGNEVGNGSSTGINTISGHSSGGIEFLNGANGNITRHNEIYANNNIGISVPVGTQQGVNPPRNLSFDASTLTLSGESAVGFDVEVYADEAAEGRNFLGTFNVSTSPWDFSVDTTGFGVANLKYLTAIQDSGFNTSAFSDTVPVFDPCLDFDVNLGPDINFACADTTLNAGGVGGSPVYSWYVTGSPGTVLGTSQLFNVSGAQNQSYTVEIDSSGCTATDDIFVSIYNKPSFTVSSVDPICFGSNDGSITITASPNQDYQLRYSDPSATPVSIGSTTNAIGQITLNGLIAGNYSNISIDSLGCQSDVNAGPHTLIEPLPIVFVLNKINDPSCEGFDGEIEIGGLAFGASYSVNYTDPQFGPMNLNNMFAVSGSIFLSGLDVGLFSDFEVIDANGCQGTDPGTINMDTPTLGLFTVFEIDPTSCSSPDGSLTIGNLISGQNYSINYDHPSLGGQSISLQEAISPGEIVIGGLEEGGYTNITVSSGIHCSEVDPGPYTLTNPAGPTFSLSKNDPTCQGGDGEMTISGLSPGGDYSVQYQNPSLNLVGPTPHSANTSGEIAFLSLDTGAYTLIQITDVISGCTSNDNTGISLAVPTFGSYSIIPSDPTCFGGGSDGLITVNTSHANGTIDVRYTNSMALADSAIALSTSIGGVAEITGLVFGNYSGFQLTRGVHCQVSESVSYTLNQPILPPFSLASIDPSCSGNDGTITISGLSPGQVYDVSYDDPTSTGQGLNSISATTGGDVFISGLDTGDFTNFQVVNASGCVGTNAGPVTLDTPTLGLFTVSEIDPTSCSSPDGSLTIGNLISGQNYSINYDHPSLGGQSISLQEAISPGEIVIGGLEEGGYTNITVSSGIHCSEVDPGPYTLTNPAGPTFSLSKNDPTCQGGDGEMTISGLSPGGDYSVQYQNPSLNLVGPTPHSANTSGEIAFLSLDTGAYTLIQIIDVISGCTSNDNSGVTLVVPTFGPYTIVPLDPTCSGGGSDGVITINTSHANGTIDIKYNDPSQQDLIGEPVSVSGVAEISGLSQGNYSDFQLTRGVHCQVTESVTYTLTQPTLPDFSLSSIDPSCTGNDGTITISGLSPGQVYDVSYDDPTSTGQGLNSISATSGGDIFISGLDTGNFTNFQVVNVSGCVGMNAGPVTLNMPTIGLFTVSTTPASCVGNDGTLTISGLTPLSNYNIGYDNSILTVGPNPQSTNTSGEITISGLGGGDYRNIQVIQAPHCSELDANVYNIGAPNNPQFSVVPKNPTCSGNDGELTIGNLTSNESYNISFVLPNLNTVGPILLAADALGEIDFTGLSAGPYTNVIVDSAGCSTQENGPFLLADPVNPNVVLDSKNPTCSGGGNDGELYILGLTNGALYDVSYDGAVQINSTSPVNDTLKVIGFSAGLITNVFVDSLGCVSNASPINFVDPVAPTIAVAHKQPTCLGTDGELYLLNLDNSTNYNISFNGSVQSISQQPVDDTLKVSGINGGTSVINISVDSAGCQSNLVSGPFDFVTPTVSSITVNKTNPSCVGGDGQLIISSLPNTFAYDVTYNDGAVQTAQLFASNDTIRVSGISGGTSITSIFIDSAGCQSNIVAGPFDYEDPVSPTISVIVNHPTCAGGDGSIVINGVQDGVTYGVSYENGLQVGPNDQIATGGQLLISSLSAANYFNVTVDSAGCSSQLAGPFELVDPQLPVFSVTTVDPTCVDGDGSLIIGGLSNAATYDLSYNDQNAVNQELNNQTPNTSGEISIPNLFGGDFTNIVLDSAGCMTSDIGPFSLTLPTVVTSVEVTGDSIVCEGTASSFAISTQVNEGVSPTYVWYENGVTAGSGITHNTIFTSSGELVLEMIPSEACASPAYDTLQIVVNPLPVTNAISGPIEVCDGQTNVGYNVTGAATSTYAWSTLGDATVVGNTSSVTVDFSSTNDQLFVTETTNQGCVGAVASFVISIQNVNTGSINGSLQPDCGETGVEYAVAGITGSTFTWTAPTGTVISSPSDSSTVFLDFGNFNGNITVQEVSSIGCVGSISSITTDLQNCALLANIELDRDTICVGDSILVQSISSGTSGATSYDWDFGTGTSNQSNLLEGPHYVTFSAVGTESVKLYVENNASVNDEMILPVYVIDFPTTVLSIAGPDTVCDSEAGVSFSIPNIVGSTFMWDVPTGAVIQSGQGTNTISVDFGSAGGEISVQETNFAGCEGSVYSKSIETRTVPGITPVSGPTSMCLNSDSVSYSAAISLQTTQYNWYVPSDAVIVDGASGNAIKVSFGAISGDVIVIPENQCGLGIADTIQVQLDSLPENPGPISGNANVCNNQTETYSIALLDRTDIYNWIIPAGASILSGTGTNQITVDFGSAGGDIRVTPSNSSCIGQSSDTSSFTIVLDSLPSLGTISGPISACNNTTDVDYSAFDFANVDSYQWTINGATSTSDLTSSAIVVDFGGVDADISVVASNSCGNTPSVSVNVIIGSLTATLTPSTDQSICIGTNVVLTASGGSVDASYQWFNNGVAQGETTDQLTVSNTSSIHVEIAEITGCSGVSDTIEIVVNELPEVDLGADLFDCDTAVAFVNAEVDRAYEWYNNGSLVGTDTAISFTTPASSTDFILVVNNTSTNCSNSDTINLTVGSQLIVKGLPTGTIEICKGESTVLQTTNNGSFTYQWFKDNVAISSATNKSLTISDQGDYSVEVTKGTTCSGTSQSVFVDVHELPVIGLKNVSACRGSVVTLTVPDYGAGFSYLWQDSSGNIVSTDTSIVSSAEGKYDFDVTITDTSGCINSQNVEVAIQHQFGVAAQAFETAQNDFEVYVDVLNHVENGALADNYFTLTASVNAAVSMDVKIVGDSIVRVIPPQNFSGQAVLTYAIENQCQVRKTGSIDLQITPNSVDDTISDFEPERLVIPISDILENDFGSIVFDSLRFEEFTEVFEAKVSINFVKQTIVLLYDPSVYDTLSFDGQVDSVKYYICDESSCDSAYLKIFIQKIPEEVQTETILEDSVQVIVYNAVSPNEDGHQDYLLIEFYFNEEEARPASSTFRLYNMWGDLVGEIEDYNSYVNERRFEGFDDDGNLLEDGTYFYTLEFKIDNGKRIKIYNQNGYIVMKR